MMETIKFFEIVRSSALLYFVISNGSFPEDLSSYEKVSFWSPADFDIENVVLGGDHFKRIHVSDDEHYMIVNFETENLDYFYDSESYFDRTGIKRMKRPYQINDVEIRQEFIELGLFYIKDFEYPVTIELKKRNDTCVIQVIILSRNLKERHVARSQHYFEGKLVSSDLLHLFTPDEMVLKHSFLPDAYPMQVDIQTLTSNHPVSEYVQHKAGILFNGNVYPFPLIPISTALRCELEFEEYNYFYKSAILRLENCRSMYEGKEDDNSFFQTYVVTYNSEFPEAQFYKLGDKLYSKKEIDDSGINLESDYTIVDYLYGKGAVDEFGKTEYYQGVKVFEKVVESKEK